MAIVLAYARVGTCERSPEEKGAKQKTAAMDGNMPLGCFGTDAIKAL